MKQLIWMNAAGSGPVGGLENQRNERNIQLRRTRGVRCSSNFKDSTDISGTDMSRGSL